MSNLRSLVYLYYGNHHHQLPIEDDNMTADVEMITSSIMLLTVSFFNSSIDFITSVSGAASAIGNVGPGLGDTIGPNGSFNRIPDIGKILLCIGMLLGRLEIFAILVMFSPAFWKN